MRDRKRISRSTKKCVGIPLAVLTAVAALGMGGCSWDDSAYNEFVVDNLVTPCPPKLFACETGVEKEAFLCMLNEDDIRDDGVANYVPCDFRMNELKPEVDESGNEKIRYIYLASNNNGEFIYLNRDEEEDLNRKYLSRETQNYVVSKYSDYKSYAISNKDNDEKVNRIDLPDGKTKLVVNLYAIAGEGTKNEAKGYENSFRYNLCPSDYSICTFGKFDETGNNYYCDSALECTVDSKQEKINADCSKRITGWASGECKNSICIVTSCNEGFQPAKDGKSCVSDCKVGQHYDNKAQKCVNDDEDNCGATGFSCKDEIKNSVTVHCDSGKCFVDACESGYTVNNNVCTSSCTDSEYYDSATGECAESDINNCGQKEYKCVSQVSSWLAGICSNNVCIATSCETGYKPSQDGKSCVSDCKVGQHYDSEKAKCVDDDKDNCGATGFACIDEIKNSATVHCDSGKCFVDTCNSGYSVNNNLCTSSCSDLEYYDSATGECMKSDIDNCGQKEYKCSEHISNWMSGKCTKNACIVEVCGDGYVVVNNECKADCGTTKYYDSATGACVASDINNCGQKDYKCSAQVSNWSSGTCSNNVCIATSCATGYKPSTDGKQCVSDCTKNEHYDSSLAKCVANDIDNCGATGYVCKDEIKNSKSVNCTEGKCYVTACNSGYSVKNNVCASSCNNTQYYDSSTSSCAISNVNNCGMKGYKCSDHISNWKSGNCTSNDCIVSACNDGYAVVGKECKADCGTTKYYDSATGACVVSDINNCGQKNYKCSSQVSNWSSGTCSNNVCIATSCATGYKPSTDGKQCVSDCTKNEHYDSSLAKCVANDIDNCGATGYVCKDEIKNSKTVNCTEGKCYVTACNSGYSVKNNVCASSCNTSQYYDSSTSSCANSNVSNCGMKGYKCSDHISNWKSGNCTSNDCIVSACNDGYAVVGKECKADCGTTKYYDSATGACVVSDINSCGQKGFKCSQNVSNWLDGTCTNNVCIATSCATGYKPSMDGKSCVSDCSDTEYYDSSTASCATSNLNNCGQKGYKCSDKILNWKSGNCNKNVCTVSSCNDGYTVKNNACVSSCSSETQYYDSSTGSCANSNINNCGQKGYKCSAHISNWSDGSCTGNACIVTDCASGYAVVGNECKADCGTTMYYDSSTGTCVASNNDNCGQKGYACSNLAGWSSGNCTNNQCVATNCASGYHKSGGKCIADSNEHCGSDSNNCTTSGKICVGGQCLVNSCNNGNTLCSIGTTNVCKDINGTDADHCGACNYKCSEHLPPNAKIQGTGSGTCTTGKCQYECKGGYTNQGSGVTADAILCVPEQVCEAPACLVGSVCFPEDTVTALHLARTSATDANCTCAQNYTDSNTSFMDGCDVYTPTE